MKKIVLFVLLSLGISSTYAQINFGILAGGRTASLRSKNESDDLKKKFFPQWHAGVVADIQMTGRFYLQPQLLISVKGGHTEAKDLDSSLYFTADVSSKERTTYLELPVNVLYKHPIGRGKLIAGAGGYVAYGLGGKGRLAARPRNSNRTGTVDYKIHFENKTQLPDNNGDYYYKPIDLGLNFMAGYELSNGLCFYVNYSRGLRNIAASDGVLPDGTQVIWGTTKNSYLGLSVGYFLKRRQ